MKQVMITLGPKAVEYITGIPDEELPTILSNLIEKSLTEQVRPIIGKQAQVADIVDQLKSLLSSAGGISESKTNGVLHLNNTRREVIVEEVDSGSVPSLEDCFDDFDFLK